MEGKYEDDCGNDDDDSYPDYYEFGICKLNNIGNYDDECDYCI